MTTRNSYMVNIKSLVFILAFFIPGTLAVGQDAFMKVLNQLPNVKVAKTVTFELYKNVYELEFTQPLDHADPNGKTFAQKAVLYHKDVNAPMVINTEGYGTRFRKRQNDVAKALDANYISVAHRFYPGALVKDGEWKYLNIKQAAGDHHLVIQTLKKV
jgi:PS-10 peptidase S37